ncbi:MAG: hypothetical protein M1821_003982 [Bathelium mastoideum]|nr:MAG: hypothetical protein M1821_003982 [Bathelium mastoideum]
MCLTLRSRYTCGCQTEFTNFCIATRATGIPCWSPDAAPRGRERLYFEDLCWPGTVCGNCQQATEIAEFEMERRVREERAKLQWERGKPKQNRKRGEEREEKSGGGGSGGGGGDAAGRAGVGGEAGMV